MYWNECQTTTIGSEGVHALVGSFSVYAYSPDVFQITPNNAVPGGPELYINYCTGGSYSLSETSVGEIAFGDAQADSGYNPCVTPQSTVQVSTADGDSKHADVSVNQHEGNISVVWVDNRSGTYQVYFSRFSTLGETLVDQIPISAPTSTASDPACSVDNNGKTHIVWKQDGNLMYCRMSPIGLVGVAPKTIVSGPIDYPDIKMSWDGSGNLTWVAASNPRVAKYRKLDNSGSTYSGCGDRILSQTVGDITTEFPAVSPPVNTLNNYPIVAWHGGTNLYSDVLYVSAIWPDCNGITNPAENTNDIRVGRIAMAPMYSQLNVYLAFEGIGQDHKQHVFVLNDAGSYYQVDSNGGWASHCDIATTDDSRILAVWDDSTACGSTGVYAQSFSGSTELPSGTACLISDPVAQGLRPSVAGVSNGVFAIAWDQEEQGQREIFLHIRSPLETCEPPIADTEDQDGDGLPDCWEVSGIPLAGTSERYVLQGADPVHKDLYLELDAMEGQAPDASALQSVVNAFSEVPNSLLIPPNPDELDGISLHILGGSGDSQCEPCVDDSTIPVEDWPNLSDFYPVKCEFFGTSEERMSPAAARLTAAKAQAFRYGILARSAGNLQETGHAEGPDPSGPGNDFMITLGDLSNTSSEEQAGTLMHELGHTLGLDHGGGDGISFKPNYYSVMNYTWQMPTRPDIAAINFWALQNYRDSWRLDYSREELPTLDETHLDETAGIGGNADLWTPVGPPFGWILPLSMLVRMGGPVDWNRDLLFYESDVRADVNYILGSSYPSVDQTLVGYNDWSHIAYLPNTTEYWTRDEGCGATNLASVSVSSVSFSPVKELTVGEFLELGGLVLDCNDNQVDDGTDISSGASSDVDQDGVPDECEPPPTSVTLERVSARRVGNTIVVEWSVSDDASVVGFDVYRSTVGSVREWVGHGQSSTKFEYRFTDLVAPDGVVTYWLAGFTRNGRVEWNGPIGVEGAGSAGVVSMDQNVPNPFRASTRITFEIPRRQAGSLKVFDLQGKEVRTLTEGEIGPGTVDLYWNGVDNEGKRVASGVYVCRLVVGSAVIAKKLIFYR